MMKKTLIFLVILALAIPSAALAATEFSLGGYIKLDTFWDSTQNSSLMHTAPARSNNQADEHGRFNARAQESRFNFTIKGPKLWGAQTTGFIEMDFDGTPDDAAVSSSGTWNARLRHAMFRLNWPETELLMGQYWGLFSSWWIESAEDGPFIMQGSALDRIPQIRVTQTFAGDWSVAGLVGLPYGATLDNAAPYSANANNGSAAESPQLQGNVTYAHDWWGKAAYYGVPKPFTATVSAGWERAINRQNGAFALKTFGAKQLCACLGDQDINQKYVNPWMVQGALFIPVIPTHSANLAGTASILGEFFVGQGVEVFGITGNTTNLYKLQSDDTYNPTLMNRFGGFVQGQYYFTNQWYLNAAYGLTRIFGVDRTDKRAGKFQHWPSPALATNSGPWSRWTPPCGIGPSRPSSSACSTPLRMPIISRETPGVPGVIALPIPPVSADVGDEHRVEFVGYFFF